MDWEEIEKIEGLEELGRQSERTLMYLKSLNKNNEI
jgi:hypothetical protein